MTSRMMSSTMPLPLERSRSATTERPHFTVAIPGAAHGIQEEQLTTIFIGHTDRAPKPFAGGHLHRRAGTGAGGAPFVAGGDIVNGRRAASILCIIFACSLRLPLVAAQARRDDGLPADTPPETRTVAQQTPPAAPPPLNPSQEVAGQQAEGNALAVGPAKLRIGGYLGVT